MQKIKLIWDFRGEVAAKTAEHHKIHLQEFLEKENYLLVQTGFDILDTMHSMAYIIINKEDLKLFRDILKPHRAEIAE